MSTTEVDPRIEARATALAQALEQRRIDELRRAAAAEIRAADEEAEHQQRVDRFVAEMPAQIQAVTVEKAEQALAKALTAYVATCAQRRAVMREAWDFIAAEGGGTVDQHSGAVTIDGQHYPMPKPERVVYDALVAIMREHFPTTMMRLRWQQ